MSKRLSIRFVVLCAALLVWQTAVAPLAHAAAFHRASSVEAVAPVDHEEHGQADMSVELPCHGSTAATTPTIAHHGQAQQHAGPDLSATPADASPAGDCCSSIACQCACIHASLNAASLSVPAQAAPNHPASLGRRDPALGRRVAQLFRPPI